MPARSRRPLATPGPVSCPAPLARCRAAFGIACACPSRITACPRSTRVSDASRAPSSNETTLVARLRDLQSLAAVEVLGVLDVARPAILSILWPGAERPRAARERRTIGDDAVWRCTLFHPVHERFQQVEMIKCSVTAGT